MREQRPNIVFIISHDLGQHLGCYGAPGVRTPHIDSLAAGGTRFVRSFCTAPQCSPSRAALWTGRYPHANGVVGLTHGEFANDLNENEVHLAQMLTDSGYETHLFGVQHESPVPDRLGYQHIHPTGRADSVGREAAEFLQNRSEQGKPFFTSIGFFEPHRPFHHEGVVPSSLESVSVPPFLPDIPIVREDLAEMEASIASLDRAVGEIVRAVGQSAHSTNTVIIMTADHGIPFPHAKMTLYDSGLEIPFIVSGTGIPAGKELNDMISNIDVMPTLLEMIGLPIPDNLHGRSFLGLLNGTAYTPREALFAEKTYHTYYDPMRAIRTERWKFIANFESAPYQESSVDYLNNARGYPEILLANEEQRTAFYHPPIELYDLEADPSELRNLAEHPVHRDTLHRLAGALREWMEQTGDPLLDGPIPQGAYMQRIKRFKAM